MTLKYVRTAPDASSKWRDSLLPRVRWAPVSEHSFATRTGFWFEEVSKIVAEQFHQSATRKHWVAGRLRSAASETIEDIIRQFTERTRSPDRHLDLEDALRSQAPGGEDTRAKIDLHVVRHDGSELMFELKTPESNLEHSRGMKRLILRTMAMKKGETAETYGACGYNPYQPDGSESPYDWGMPKQFLEIGQDFLIGRQFWEKIGDSTTYDEVWEIAESVGRSIESQVDQIIETRFPSAPG